MAIIQTIGSAYEFEQAFKAYGREDNFSNTGLRALFDYLDESGADIELDVVGLCCEYSEDNYSDIADNYSIDLSEADGDEDEEKQIVIDYLQDNTVYVGEGEEDNLIYQAF